MFVEVVEDQGRGRAPARRRINGDLVLTYIPVDGRPDRSVIVTAREGYSFQVHHSVGELDRLFGTRPVEAWRDGAGG